MVVFELITIAFLLAIFLIILWLQPDLENTWKIGRMSCRMLMIKNKQFHCVWEGRAGICNRHECPMMEHRG